MASQRTVYVDRRDVLRTKRCDPGSKGENRFLRGAMDDYAGRSDELWACVVVVFDVKKRLGGWKSGQTLSEAILIVSLYSVLWGENGSGHFFISVLMGFYV